MKSKYFPIIAIFLLWLIFGSPFFLKGKVPFPSSYQVNFFAPWSTYKEFGSPVKNNAQPDIITQIYPWRYFDISELKKGRFPFWNPYSFSGTPHLANYQSAVLFPLNILFFLPLSFIDIWSLLVLLQPLLAGLFTYFFMRSLKVSKSGSLLSSFSFMFCGFITTWMGYATLGYAILFLPLALFAINKYFETQKKYFLILLSLTFLFSYFSGHFQTSIYFSFGIFGYIVYHLLFFKNKKAYFETLLFSFFGILLVMPQILPSIEFYIQSVRSVLFEKVEAIPWNYLPTLLSPDFFGNPVTRNDWFGHYAEWNGYAGAIPLMFAFFALLFKRNKETVFFIILLFTSLLLAYNTPLLSLIVFLKIPVLSTSAASRIIVLFSFSVAVLAGFGFDSFTAISKKEKNKLLAWIGIIIFIILAIVGIAFLHFLPLDKMLIARKNFILPVAIVISLVVLCTVFFISHNAKKRFVFIILILSISGFEMLRFAVKWQTFDPKNLVFKQVPTSKFYNNNPSFYRYSGDFTAENAVYYRLLTPNGYDPLYPGRYAEFIKAIGNGTVAAGERSVVDFPKDGKYTPLAINLLGIKYFAHKISNGQASWAFPFNKYPLSQFTKIYDDSHYQIFRNNYVFNRVLFVNKVRLINNKQQIVNYMFSHNLQQNAVVEKNTPKLDSEASGEARIIQYLPNKVVISAQSTGRAFLVLTDNYYPGWVVKVNGIKSKIYRADYTFRGVVIPKGKSVIEFSYFPMSFLIGIYLFLLGILGILSQILISYFKKVKI